MRNAECTSWLPGDDKRFPFGHAIILSQLYRALS